MHILGKLRRLKSRHAQQSCKNKGIRVLHPLLAHGDRYKSSSPDKNDSLPSSELGGLTSAHDAAEEEDSGPSAPLSELWRTALTRVQQQEQWSLFCKIVEKQLGHTASTTEPSVFTPGSIQREAMTVERRLPDHSRAEEMHPTVDNEVGLAEMFAEILHALNAQKSPLERGRIRQFCVNSSKILVSSATIGSALTSLNPYASLAWGLLQFIAGAVVSIHQVQEACWRNLNGLEELIEHARTLRQYYDRRTRFQHADLLGELDSAMVNLLTSVIAYQVSVVIFNYSKAEKGKTLLRGTESSSPMKLFHELEANENHLLSLDNKMRLLYHDDILEDLETQLLQTRASLRLMGSRVETHLKNITDHLTKREEDQAQDEFDSIVDWISTSKYEDAHCKVSRLPLKGTTDWLFQLERFQTWIRSERNEILWLDGKLGSGKTCVTHSVINECIEICKRNTAHAAAYFYCDGSKELKAMSVNSILCCLLKQLVISSGTAFIPYQLRHLYTLRKHTSSSLTTEQCLEMLRTIAGRHSRITFILDGFDECPDYVRCDLVERLVSVFEASPTIWKLFVSTRRIPDALLLRDLHQRRNFHTSHVEIEQHNEHAIDTFIEARVRTAAALDSPLRRLYYFDKHDQCAFVEHELKVRAQGVFRWAAVALDFLHRSKHYRSMNKATKELHTFVGLNSLYQKLYVDISREAQECGFEDKLRLILSFVLYSKTSHGSSSAHIADACSYFEKDYDNDHQPSYTVEDIAAFCPGLIEYDRDFLVVPHFSVREFLLSQPSGEFCQQNAHAFLADKCLRVFTQPENAPLTLTVYATRFWDQHLRMAELNGSTRTDLAARCASLQVSSLAFSVDEFLLCEATPEPFQRWLHTIVDRSSFTPNIRFATKPASTLFARISLDIGWKDMQDFENYRHVQSDAHVLQLLSDHPRHMKENLMQFAVSIGAMPVIEWLIARNVDMCQSDLTGLNLLEHYVLHRGEERDLSFPDQPATLDMINYLRCQGLEFQVNAHGENVFYQMARQPPLFFSREMFDAVEAHDVATLIFNNNGQSLLEAALAGPSKSRPKPNNIMASLIGPSYLKSEHWDAIKDKVFRLVTTARIPNVELLTLVLKRGIDVTRREKIDKHDYLPIERMAASINFHGRAKAVEEALELLTLASIEQGVDMKSVAVGIHKVHKDRYWPFFSCILENGNVETIKIWVEYGANPVVTGKLYRKIFRHSLKRSAGRSRYPVEVEKYFMSLPKAPKTPKPVRDTKPKDLEPLDMALESGIDSQDQPTSDKSLKVANSIDIKVPAMSNIRVEENVFYSGTEVIYLN